MSYVKSIHQCHFGSEPLSMNGSRRDLAQSTLAKARGDILLTMVTTSLAVSHSCLIYLLSTYQSKGNPTSKRFSQIDLTVEQCVLTGANLGFEVPVIAVAVPFKN